MFAQFAAPLVVGLVALTTAMQLASVRPMTRRAIVRSIGGVLIVFAMSILGLIILFQLIAVGAFVLGVLVFFALVFGSLIGVTRWLSEVEHVRRS
ncbi:MAG: hypothetical protein ACOYBJ_03215 [Patescibacteria group bacterium]|jgi:hypothetical protein